MSHFLEKDHNVVRDEAREFMRTVQERSVEYDSNRKISLILEYIPGKITDSIDRLIALYRPDSVVVGTRGRRFGASLVQGFGVGLPAIGSISKCVFFPTLST
jgi:nucleotide-binding universal stress UspA family protein